MIGHLAQDHRSFLGTVLANRSRSDWKTACHKFCGGVYFAQLIIIIGTVDDRVLRIYNAKREQKTPDAEARQDEAEGAAAGSSSSGTRTMLSPGVPAPHMSQSRWGRLGSKGKGKGFYNDEGKSDGGRGKAEVRGKSGRGKGKGGKDSNRNTDYWGSMAGMLHEVMEEYVAPEPKSFQ